MNAILSILGIMPVIIQTIKAIEAAIPNAGQGKAKLDAVLEIITNLDESFQQYLPQLSTVIGTLVKLFNAVGLFKKPAA